MNRYVFSDFDHFADTISGLNGRYIPTAPSASDWWIDPVRVARLKVQQLQVGAPAAFAGDGEPGEVTVGIPISDPTAIRIDGDAMAEDSFILIRQDQPLTYSSLQTTRWAGITVPLDIATSPLFPDPEKWVGSQLRQTRVQAASASTLRRLTLLVAWLCRDHGWTDTYDPAVRAAAEEAILTATARLLRTRGSVEGRRSPRRRVGRDRILARCLDFVRANEGRAILVADLCHQAQVNESTLRSIFHEYFGVGPEQFLKVRQLQEVRSALLSPHVAQQSVEQTAARVGVWDFGTFERDYRTLYGEGPSDTLPARPLRQGAHRTGDDLASLQSWMRYAARYFEPSL